MKDKPCENLDCKILLKRYLFVCKRNAELEEEIKYLKSSPNLICKKLRERK